MSWDSYITSFLEGAGKGNGGAIIGLNGGVWAVKGLNVQAAEAQALAQAMSTGNVSNFQQAGIHLGGKKFTMNRYDGEEGVLYAKQGKTGVSCYKTNQAVIIGYYEETMASPGQSSDATYKCAKYLMDAGY